MLGDMIGGGKGHRTGRRVVATHPEVVVETSFEDMSTLYGVTGLNMGSYTSRVRPDGSLVGEGKGAFAAQDGSISTWIGMGTGVLKPDGSVSYRGSLVYSTTNPKLAKLNSVAGAFEFEVAPDGSTESKIWEWK